VPDFTQSPLGARDLVRLDLDIGRAIHLNFPLISTRFFCEQLDRGVRWRPWRHSVWQSPCEGWLADPEATLLPVVSIPLCEQQAQVLGALMQEV
jgi:hypothetical protein